MKIDDSLSGVTALRGRTPRKTKDSSGQPAGQAHTADSVEITQASAQLNQLEEELRGLPGNDAGKVEAVRQAIAEGSFQVNEEAVADALVQSAMEQLRRNGGEGR